MNCLAYNLVYACIDLFFSMFLPGSARWYIDQDWILIPKSLYCWPLFPIRHLCFEIPVCLYHDSSMDLCHWRLVPMRYLCFENPGSPPELWRSWCDAMRRHAFGCDAIFLPWDAIRLWCEWCDFDAVGCDSTVMRLHTIGAGSVSVLRVRCAAMSCDAMRCYSIWRGAFWIVTGTHRVDLA